MARLRVAAVRPAIGDVEQAARFEQAGAVGLFGLVAGGKRYDDGATAGWRMSIRVL